MNGLKKVALILSTALGLSLCVGIAACETGEHTHSFGSWETVTPATCTRDGVKRASCTVEGCNEKKEEPIPKLGHDLQRKEDPAASCGKEGLAHITCSRCDYSYDEVLSALEHSYRQISLTGATCTTPSVAHQRCSNCGAERDVEVSPALGHDMENEVIHKAATCTEPGLHSGYCVRCKKDYENAEIPALGHEWGSGRVIEAPTCAKEGKKMATCSRCGTSSGELPIPTLPHEWETDYQLDNAPTYEAAGQKSIHCKNCDTVKDQVTLPRLQEGVEADYELRLADLYGSRLKLNCNAVLKDSSGNMVKQVSFSNGVVNASLVPGDYTIEFSGLPSGYVKKAYNLEKESFIKDFILETMVFSDEAPDNTIYSVGSVMYDFTITDTNDNNYRLSELTQKYKLIMLNFWGIFCEPCRREFPGMQKAWEANNKDVFLIAISTAPGDTKEEINDYKETGTGTKLTFPMATSAPIIQRFAFDGVPTTVLIDKGGKVVYQATGSPAERAEEHFNQLFKQYLSPMAQFGESTAQDILENREYLPSKQGEE